MISPGVAHGETSSPEVEIVAGADPHATISPTALAVERTMAALAPAPSAAALPELPLITVSDGGPSSPAADIVITGSLGAGGMGRVDLGRQCAFDRPVAVKRVRPEVRCDVAVRAFVDEARLTGELDHPNIAPAHLLGRSPTGEPVLVMKRIEGVAWRALAMEPAHPAWGDRAGDPLGRHLEILRQVCNAVEFAHRRGVVHRDIKAENVMVGDLGEVYLIDWGVAVRTGDPPSPHMAGTPCFMAPEMLHGSARVSPRTDVYLLGATLHEILTGTPRHPGDTLDEVVRSVERSAPVAYGAGVPAELAAIASRATARDPADRFPSALAFSEAIAEFERHRGSLKLTDEASLVLERLRGELARRPAGDAPGVGSWRAELRRLAAECAFAYRLALREWPENAAARDGLAECRKRTTEFELGERNVPGVEALLAESEEPDPPLAAALERLRRTLAEEALAAEKLARIERDNDLFLAGATGGWSPFIFSAVLGAACMGLSKLGVRLDGAGLLALCAAMLAMAVPTLWSQRRSLVYNGASARRALGVLAVFPFFVAAALVGWAEGTPVAYTVEVIFLGQALMAAVVGITIARILLIGVPLYLATLAVLVWWPHDALFEFGLFGLASALVNRIEASVIRARRTARA